MNFLHAGIIKHIQAVFTTQSENWYEGLPAEIKASVDRGLKQSESAQTISHEEAMKPYKKWLKK